MNFIMGKDDEFEDEPEDELASAGMHVVEDIEDDAVTDKPPVDEDELVDVVVEDNEDEDEKESGNVENKPKVES